MGRRLEIRNGMLGQKEDVAAIGAFRQMGEALLALRLGQRAFDESAQPIGIEMGCGRCTFAHDRTWPVC